MPIIEKEHKYQTLRGVISSYKKRQIGESELNENVFYFLAEISNTNLDSYFTRMDFSTLQNFAEDAANGVSLQDSHDYRKLGYGQSFSGRFEEDKVIAEFYTVAGIRFGGTHSYATTDDFIRAIEGALVRDVSVGFYGGRTICDICGHEVWGWDSDCPHFPGKEYPVDIDGDGELELVTATATVYDARLAEVSVVFDGATPEAMIIEKATQMFDKGKLNRDQVRSLEQNFQVRILQPNSHDIKTIAPKISDHLDKSGKSKGLDDDKSTNKNKDVIPESTNLDTRTTDSDIPKVDESRNTDPKDSTKDKKVNPDTNKSNNKEGDKSQMDLEKIQETLKGFRNRIADAIEDLPEDEIKALETLIEEYESVSANLETTQKSLDEYKASSEKFEHSSNEFESSSKKYKKDLDELSEIVGDVRNVKAKISEEVDDLPEEIDKAFELIYERFKTADAESTERGKAKAELEIEVEKLRPLAEDGKKYREKIVDYALTQGVRAFGDDFNEEEKREMLESSTLDMVDKFRKSWEEIGDFRHKKSKTGRKVQNKIDDEDELEPDSDNFNDYIPIGAFK